MQAIFATAIETVSTYLTLRQADSLYQLLDGIYDQTDQQPKMPADEVPGILNPGKTSKSFEKNLVFTTIYSTFAKNPFCYQKQSQ